MKTVTLLYFASLREQRGLAQETISTSAVTIRELYNEIKIQHGLTLELKQLRIASNEAFVTEDAAFNEGDRIAFLPPVSGG